MEDVRCLIRKEVPFIISRQTEIPHRRRGWLQKRELPAGQSVLYAGMTSIFLYLLYRDMGLYPLVMADEWVYSLYSRLLPFSQSSIPSYLFFWIYRQTNHCGASYTDCARLFNCIFFVFSAPFLYAIARQFVGPLCATFVALLAIASPINTYTAYFMPEAMYYFGFWLLSWLVLGAAGIRPLHRAMFIGVTLVGLSMVKVHAIFLLPGVCAAMVARCLIVSGRKKISTAVAMLICIGVTALLVRLVAGYLFAGEAGLHILGQKYGAAADSSMKIRASLALIKNLLFILKGHLAALALMFGAPLASLLVWSKADQDSSFTRELLVVRVYTIFMIVVLLLATACYTASVAAQPHESLGRLHFRYYNFAFPLFLIIACAESSLVNVASDRRRRLAVGVVIAVLAIYAAFTVRTHHVQNIVDSPELWVAFASRAALYAIAFINLTALGVWIWNRRYGARLFLFVTVPITIVVSGWFITPALRGRLHSDTYEQAAQVARQIVGVRERSNLTVVGSDEVDLYRALYQIDSAHTTMVALPEHAPLQADGIPANGTWLLVIGDHAVPEEFELRFSRESYGLFRRVAPTR